MLIHTMKIILLLLFSLWASFVVVAQNVPLGIAEPRLPNDNSCVYANDRECDDGGPGFDTNLCLYGTDISDCGRRSLPNDDSCRYANDDACDDGGDDSTNNLCEYATDMTDCGIRRGPQIIIARIPWQDPKPDFCPYTKNGRCEDGGEGASGGACPYGTDDGDCAVREPIANSVALFGILNNDSCRSASDGQCDDGEPGAHSSLCSYGTDYSDCGLRAVLNDDSCSNAKNGRCDDGGLGSFNSMCVYGTDYSDCGARRQIDLSPARCFGDCERPRAQGEKSFFWNPPIIQRSVQAESLESSEARSGAASNGKLTDKDRALLQRDGR